MIGKFNITATCVFAWLVVMIAGVQAGSEQNNPQSYKGYCQNDKGEMDWNCVCKDLCRNGEGGSLCNCDLPPLSREQASVHGKSTNGNDSPQNAASSASDRSVMRHYVSLLHSLTVRHKLFNINHFGVNPFDNKIQQLPRPVSNTL